MMQEKEVQIFRFLQLSRGETLFFFFSILSITTT